MGAAQEWKDVAIEACKAVVLLLILESLYLTPNTAWLEEQCVARPGYCGPLARADLHAPSTLSPAASTI